MTGALRVLFLVLLLSVSLSTSNLQGDDQTSPDPNSATPARLPVRSRVHDLEGHQHALLESSDDRGVALIFLSTECPMCNECFHD